MLLILTNTDDLTADFFILYLEECGIPYFRFNVDRFPTSVEMEYRTTSNGIVGVISDGHCRIALEDVSVIWYRRALLPPSIVGLEEDSVPYIRQESRHFLEGTFLALRAPWVNSLYATQIGERKLYQLRVAYDCGFSIPKTIVGNNPLAFQGARESKGGFICKPIYCGLQITKNGCYSAYTHQPDYEDLEDYAAIRLCPTYLQEEISRIEDIRVTFFGASYFAVSIKSDEGLIDWRRPGAQLHYKEVDLDEVVIDSCCRFMSELGLFYGAFDFIRDKTGQLYFLEINPAGEWAWLEKELGLSMREALLNLIEKVKIKK